MATITIKGEKSFDVEDGSTRLTTAIEDAGIDILHRCGGYAGCTTCRVEFHEGEPENMTEAEAKKLVSQDLLGEVRLSCQILCDHDMTVTPVYRLSEMENMDDAGPRLKDDITPDPVWIDASEAENVADEGE
jgi:ferredoxin